ncbi:SDR family NAD(P)-dependent oxidoreductase [Gordonia paraffinivorans]|uniref:SDR family NAD(P)-dependent oxidoreductase n=1 Tax=Gordonia paraffinivorans TaxID=175628 RepID=UPI001E5DE2E9|nr:SDR family NAD(P)-dependent oxidoreductase [Gordonia paraffinivorans]MCD2145676.1 SDR family NAD(P)-dependent oxidoreductase [Gordonia paraffinivorans]
MFELTGRIAFVSGAGQSVGEGIAKVLARQGTSVIVNDLHAERAEKVAAGIVEEGNRAVRRPSTSPTSTPRATASARRRPNSAATSTSW